MSIGSWAVLNSLRGEIVGECSARRLLGFLTGEKAACLEVDLE